MSVNYTHFATYKGQMLNKDYFLDEKDNLYYIDDNWLVAVPVDYDGTVALELYFIKPRRAVKVNPIYERVNHYALVQDVRSKSKKH